MIKWTVMLAVSLAWAGVARAAAEGPDEQYLEIYDEILHADSAQQTGDARDAATQYRDVENALIKFKANYPSWNPEVIDFRIGYAADQLKKLQQYLPANTPAPVAAQTPAATPAPAPEAAPSPEVLALHDQIQRLMSANIDLENRLKEALSVQPAAVSPVELSKAQAKIVTLEKERDLLKVALDQAKAAPPPESTEPSESGKVRQLKKELAANRKEFEALERVSKRELKEAEKKASELQRKLDAALAQPSAPAPVLDDSALKEQIEQLQARLAVMEASPVPYTEEELALLKQTPPAATAPLPAATPKHVGHSKEDLPPGAGAMMAEAMRAVMERNFPEAEAKLGEILSQDENNVYVLAYLANTQLAENHLKECDQTVQRALKIDPNDPASLYLLGVVRYQQERYKDALNALSRSAQLNPTNASTENYLGCVLAEEGQRKAAETALRLAVHLDPGSPEANYNLAFVYATSKPPMPELALWHYQRAVAQGHPKNAALEKLLPPN